ncbi:hypothetical protein [Frankia sp. AgB32]|uniref:hypothetical protein n=1 Tax=Frankia sp. AgB32 TaxID=631119 RepID=UPI00200CD5B6|nr:hypothetical protein [Frankia sp. AgB32]MCK9893430.1 hypothetical protein [Frankia sp. AgB32]
MVRPGAVADEVRPVLSGTRSGSRQSIGAADSRRNPPNLTEFLVVEGRSTTSTSRARTSRSARRASPFNA